MKVSFDYDSTLSRKAIQKYAKSLLDDFEVWIVTSRRIKGMPPRVNNDLFRTAFYVGIPSHHIHFTEFEDKCDYFKNHNDFLFHVDDDMYEIHSINEETNVKGVLCWPPKSTIWKEKCEDIINGYKQFKNKE